MARSEAVLVYELYQIEESGHRSKIGENASARYLESRVRHLKRLPGNQTLRFDIVKRKLLREKK